MSTMPHMQIENLELRALEERHQLHERANELKTRIAATRETLDVEKQARKHFGPAAVIVAGVGLLSGYALGGIFTQR